MRQASVVLAHPPRLEEMAKRIRALTERPATGPATARLLDLERRLDAMRRPAR